MAKETVKKIFCKIQLEKSTYDFKINKYLNTMSKKVKGINEALFNTVQVNYKDYTSSKNKKENLSNNEEKLSNKKLDQGSRIFKKDYSQVTVSKNIVKQLLEIKEHKRRSYLSNLVKKAKDITNLNNHYNVNKDKESKKPLSFSQILKNKLLSRNNLINDSNKEINVFLSNKLPLNLPIDSEYYMTTNDSSYINKGIESIHGRAFSGKVKENNLSEQGLNSVRKKVASAFMKHHKSRKDSDFMQDLHFNPTFITGSQDLNSATTHRNDIQSDISNETDFLQCFNNSRKESKVTRKKTMVEKYEDDESKRTKFPEDEEFEINDYFQTFTNKNRSIFPKNKRIYEILKICNEEYQKSEHINKKIMNFSTHSKTETKRFHLKNNLIDIAKKNDKDLIKKMKNRKVIFSTNNRNQPKMIHLNKDNIFIKNNFASSLNELNAYTNRYYITERFNIKLKNSEIATLNMNRKRKNSK